MNMKQYETFELRFGGEVLPDAWAQIDLTATFSCAQESLTVKGFYDGESDGRGVYVVRFLPQYAGVYRYQVRGAVTAEGEIVCEASSPEAHGIVRAVGTHFAFADGAPYIPFGTTVYALISQDDALVEQTLQSLAAAVRLCVPRGRLMGHIASKHRLLSASGTHPSPHRRAGHSARPDSLPPL